MVHLRHRAQEHAAVGPPAASTSSSGQRRDRLRRLAEGRSRLAPPSRPRRRRRRRPDGREPPTSTTALSARSAPPGAPRRRQVRPAPPPSCFVDPDAGPERSSAIVRHPDTRGSALAAALPCPPASPTRRRAAAVAPVRPAERGATADPEPTATPTARTNARAAPVPTPAPPPEDTYASGATAFVTDASSTGGHSGPSSRRPRSSWSDAPERRSSVRSIGPSGRANGGWSSARTVPGKTTLLSAIGLELWPTAGTVDVLGARYGRIDSREIRRRIGVSGSAIEGTSARPDPDYHRHDRPFAATQPWWHVYTDADTAWAIDLLVGLGLAGVARHPTHPVGGRGPRTVDRAGPDAGSGPAPAGRARRKPRSRSTRDPASATSRKLAAQPRPSAIAPVTHHVEEIPTGFTHALVLADGRLIAAGPLDEVVTDHNLTLPTSFRSRLEHPHGASWARMRLDNRPRRPPRAHANVTRRRRCVCEHRRKQPPPAAPHDRIRRGVARGFGRHRGHRRDPLPLGVSELLVGRLPGASSS